MNKVYDIETTTNSPLIQSVVSENIGQAERLFLAEFPTAIIKRVILHSEYALTVGMPAITDMPKPETCKWKCDYDKNLHNPHKEIEGTLFCIPRGAFPHDKFCVRCGKEIEVVQ